MTETKQLSTSLAPRFLFAVAGLGLGGGLIFLRTFFFSLEGSVAGIAGLLPFGYGYAAGMVAAVNPCGVMFLPSLMAFYLADEGAERVAGWRRGAAALGFGVFATVGFLVLFAAAGLVFALGGAALAAYFSWAGIAVGVALLGAGLWSLATDRSFGIAAASRALGVLDVGQAWRSPFLFGIAYGVASLACTLPIFLVVVGTSLVGGGVGPAALQFGSYALGMGTIVTAVMIAAAFFQSAVYRMLMRVAPHIHHVAAAFLVSAGVFILAYWLEAVL
ncbi:MAG TPA: cytochrome c biogenesis protein CcdA [Chloroflexota bacterium]